MNHPKILDILFFDNLKNYIDDYYNGNKDFITYIKRYNKYIYELKFKVPIAYKNNYTLCRSLKIVINKNNSNVFKYKFRKYYKNKIIYNKNCEYYYFIRLLENSKYIDKHNIILNDYKKYQLKDLIREVIYTFSNIIIEICIFISSKINKEYTDVYNCIKSLIENKEYLSYLKNNFSFLI